jgi:hypothetical protein
MSLLGVLVRVADRLDQLLVALGLAAPTWALRRRAV